MVANLEDLVTDLRKKCERMEETFAQYLDQREAHRQLIENFDDDMAVLHQVLLHYLETGKKGHLQVFTYAGR